MPSRSLPLTGDETSARAKTTGERYATADATARQVMNFSKKQLVSLQ